MKKAFMLLAAAATLNLTVAQAQTTPKTRPGASRNMQQGTPEQRAGQQT